MSDPRNKLKEMFDESNRYPTFGDLLMRMHVQGFRCHNNTVIEIASPITAFCGLNGTGKSTLLQLAAASYKSPSTDVQSYYINDFLVVGTLDPNPFADAATVEYRFWQADRSLKQLTLSRNSTTKRWQGYSRRPERRVFFAGIGLYLPKIEQRDFITRNANRLDVSSHEAVANMIKQWTCRILGQNYDQIISNTVTYSHRTGKVLSVQRATTSYSESHMGYGEGRSQYLIAALETLPDKSLVLIEEPETSLHPSAQYEFGRYLMDVVIRKRHQVLLTTHSESVLEALPSNSRVYLKKMPTGIDTILGLTALQAKSLMAEGNVKALHVLVEDRCARVVLCEIIRRNDPDFLRSIGIYPIGDADTIQRTVTSLQGTGLPVAAVRDGDKGAAPNANLFKLPGTLPPEKELFSSNAVKEYFQREYSIDLENFSATLTNVDHHNWFGRLAIMFHQEEIALISEAARAYVANLSEAETSTLVDLLKEASQR